MVTCLLLFRFDEHSLSHDCFRWYSLHGVRCRKEGRLIFKKTIFNNKSVRFVHEMSALLKSIVFICSYDYGLIFQILWELNFGSLPLLGASFWTWVRDFGMSLAMPSFSGNYFRCSGLVKDSPREMQSSWCVLWDSRAVWFCWSLRA